MMAELVGSLYGVGAEETETDDDPRRRGFDPDRRAPDSPRLLVTSTPSPRACGSCRAPHGSTARETWAMMITRMWRGWTRAEDADAYERFLLDELFPSMRPIAGFLGADVLRRVDGDEVAFVTLTRFASLDAIRAFAGDDYETPVIAPRAHELLSRRDDRAHHFETASFAP
jgi:heme-degrading monooxygenase HmoA